MTLDGAWRLRPSAKATEGGAVLSRAGFVAEGWYDITVPNTVVGALVENRTYPDPYTAMNLRALPGMTYPVARNFGHLPMSPESPFAGYPRRAGKGTPVIEAEAWNAPAVRR